MCGQQLGWELCRCSAMVIFPLWASISSSAMEIATLGHVGGASEGGFVKGYDTAWGWKGYMVTGSQLSVLICYVYIIRVLYFQTARN